MTHSLTILPDSDYSADRFWTKVAKAGRRAGVAVIEKALWLYYAAERPDTPAWAKATVYGALAYFILPADAVPDLVPITGFTDDLAVLTFAIATIGAHIDERVKSQATETLSHWFGSD